MLQKANEDFLSEIFSEDLKIQVEEKIDENKPFYFISGFGNLNFKDKDFKSIEEENDQAKFTVYASLGDENQLRSAFSLSSFNCFLSTSEGAWVIKQVAF